jgi:hypothetical protein
VTLTLNVYTSSGQLVRTLSIGTASAPLQSVAWSPQPYNPAAGPLLLSDGAWSYAYDGKDDNGDLLQNGVYLLEIVSRQGSSTSTVEVEITVIGSEGGGLLLTAAPNPARSGSGIVIQWLPATQRVDLEIYDMDGGLVRNFGELSSPAVWTQRTGGGEQVAGGVYVICARIPGQKQPAFFKLAVIR